MKKKNDHRDKIEVGPLTVMSGFLVSIAVVFLLIYAILEDGIPHPPSSDADNPTEDTSPCAVDAPDVQEPALTPPSTILSPEPVDMEFPDDWHDDADVIGGGLPDDPTELPSLRSDLEVELDSAVIAHQRDGRWVRTVYLPSYYDDLARGYVGQPFEVEFGIQPEMLAPMPGWVNPPDTPRRIPMSGQQDRLPELMRLENGPVDINGILFETTRPGLEQDL